LKTDELAREIFQEYIMNKPTGGSLPSENQMAAQFGVSRLKIRESLKFLLGQSLISSSKGRRAQIVTDHGNLLEYLVTTTAARNINWYSDLCHVRMALESEAALLAASQYKSLNLESPRLALASMDELAREIQDKRKNSIDVTDLINTYNEADLQFHKTLVETCHSNTISLFYSSLSGLMQQSFELTQNIQTNPTKDFCRNVGLHKDIFENIRLGHPNEAKQIIRHHMIEVQAQLRIVAENSQLLVSESGTAL
jgi:DNA-binding FadR family transcriptional regulator